MALSPALLTVGPSPWHLLWLVQGTAWPQGPPGTATPGDLFTTVVVADLPQLSITQIPAQPFSKPTACLSVPPREP